MSTTNKDLSAGRLIVRAAGVLLFAAMLHACSAQGDSAQVNSRSGTGASGTGTDSTSTGGHANQATAPIIDVNVTPTTLDAGGSVTITWTTQNATSCAGSGAWSGDLALNNTSGLVQGPLAAGTYVYGVTCAGKGGSTVEDETVQVGAVAAPVISLTIAPTSLQPGASATLTWSTTNATSCVGTGGTGSDAWATDQPTASAGFNTDAIASPGQYEYNLSCTGPGGSSEVSKAIIVAASASPPAPTITGFAATPTQIQPGQTTTFSWSSNATSCTASGGSGSDGWSGTEPASSTGTVVGPIANAGRYSYTLTCAGPGGNSANTTDVLVSASPTPPIVSVSIGVLPLQIVAGTTASLTWSTSNANTCAASGSWNGSKPLLGSAVPTRVLTAAGTYTFTLTCTGDNNTSGSGTATLIVTPAPATVSSFAASPTAIQTNQSTSLSWTSNGATTCAASGGTGSDGWTGSVATSSTGMSVGPLATAGTYTYSLACTGPGGSSTPQSVNVAVTAATPPVPTITSLVATPPTVQAGGSVLLSWGSANATSCAASGGTAGDGWTGSVGTASLGTSVGPLNTTGTYTYTLTCAGPTGVNSQPTSVAINVSATPTPAATVATFTAVPSTIQVNQSAQLAWTTNAATSCTASGGPSNSWTGTLPPVSAGTSTGPISTAGSVTYALTCTGPGGTGAPSSVTINVNNPPSAAASIGAFAAASTSVQTGQGTTLSWTTTNANTCTASGGLLGTDGWSGTVATSSTSAPIGPFATAGIYTYTLNCSGTGGASNPSSVTINVSNPPAQATVTTFVATPASLQTGQSALLTWTSSGATSCAATGGTGSWTGSVGTSSLGTSTGALNTAGSYIYTLTCSGAAGAGPASSVIINVTSAPPPAASVSGFSATPNSIVVGQSTSLSWSTTSATSCLATGGTGSDGWNGPVGTSSSGFSTGVINTAGNYTYILTCTGPGGAALPQSIVVDVAAAPAVPTIALFTVLPPTAQTGQSVVAGWTTLNATSCTASGGTGSDGWSGTVATGSLGTPIGPVTPAGNYTYTLTCTGAGGLSSPSTASLTVTDAPVPPTIGSFSASPVAIQTGGSTTLSWATTNATSCTAGGGTGSWTGNVGTSSTGTTIGPISAPGIYVFTLTCAGTGGTSATGTATVTVTTAIPPASIVTFLATPTTITAGGSVVMTWVSSGASACTASGGTGSDGWNGTEPTTSLGKTVGPINTAGLYVYTLNCTGPGGASSPASVDVTVNAATPAATVGSFGAAPSAVTVGQYSYLAWTTSNATSCTAGGGTGADGWSGAQAATSVSTKVGPFTAAGTVNYTLTCTGPGGTSSAATTAVTVSAATPQQPTVSLKAGGHTSLTVQTGATASMTWTSSNATSCVASGGAGSDGWPGAQPITSTGLTIGPVSVPGTYTYTLTCSGTGGTGSSSVQITYLSANSTDCGIAGLATTSLVAPAASATNTVQGICVGCGVLNQSNLITAGTTTPASVVALASLLGADVVLHVNDGTTTFPAGRQVGFIMETGNSLLSLSLLQNVILTTYLNGTPVQQASAGNQLLTLQALGLLSVNANAGFAGFTATQPFNQVSVQVNSLAGVATTLNVYRACVSLQ